MSYLKFNYMDEKDGVRSTVFENAMYFVSFNLNKDNELNVNVVSKEFSYPSINVFYGNEVSVNIAATGSKNISEIKKHVSQVEAAIETASQIETLMQHYIL